LVTGGAGDIGAGVVRALRADGWQVAVLDLRSNPDANLSLLTDVTSADAVTASVSQVVDGLGVPTALVCAAGVVTRSLVAETVPEEWDRVVDVSLTSAFLATRAVLPTMVAAGGGAIVTLSSGLARKGYPYGAAYAAAKAGIEALTKTIALEYVAAGVRANAVAPGPIDTAMTSGNPNFDAGLVLAGIPMGRLGTVEEVVGPVMFLLSDAASYITGHVLHVNGGMLMP
jgi:3-oxoacyl-[acyl-carrier protein] reductase